MPAVLDRDPGPGTPAGDLWLYTQEGYDLNNGFDYYRSVYQNVLPAHANSLDVLANRAL